MRAKIYPVMFVLLLVFIISCAPKIQPENDAPAGVKATPEGLREGGRTKAG